MLSKFWIKITGSLLIAVSALAMFSLPVWAAVDLAIGSKIFKVNCVSCHIGGRNTVVADKSLSLAALQKYNMNSSGTVITQVTNGKGAMPAFSKRLKPEEIESVAAYVLDQAQKNWKKGLAQIQQIQQNSTLLASVDNETLDHYSKLLNLKVFRNLS